MSKRHLILAAGLLLLAGLFASPQLKRASTDLKPFSDTAGKARCPVCGMFVEEYPAWLCSVRFNDGHEECFDGAKDLFKYLVAMPHYAPNRDATQVQSVLVTDYYSLNKADGRQAWYVLGSDVLGPMGNELVPFDNEQAAREFLRDHHGTQILQFGEVTTNIISRL